MVLPVACYDICPVGSVSLQKIKVNINVFMSFHTTNLDCNICREF